MNSNTAEKIREKIGLAAPSGIQTGECLSVRVEGLQCELIYIANIGPTSTDKVASKKVSMLYYVNTSM